jgi:hypothetical protein
LTHNFAKRHKAIGMTPAQALGIMKQPLTINDLVDLIRPD